jgi:ubiquinone biosynthesis monooxygenase Coq7
MSGTASASRANPARSVPEGELSTDERRHSAGLMRVNHVGEICAQALYESQGRLARDGQVKNRLADSGREEEDHLAWTAERLRELGARPSLLNPFWYAGSFVLGSIAARLGDAYSLGFVVETERQVEAHLASHLQMLPAQDGKSRAIVEQMRVDEMVHGAAAQSMGAATVPLPMRQAMRAIAKLMTSSAYYL